MQSGLPWGIRPFESIKVHHLNSIYVETDEFKYTDQIAWKVQLSVISSYTFTTCSGHSDYKAQVKK